VHILSFPPKISPFAAYTAAKAKDSRRNSLDVPQFYSAPTPAAVLLRPLQGPTSWSVRNWVRQFRQSGELPTPEHGPSSADELRQLRKENDRLRMENEILKKAAAYFAREVTR
jgi:hypothetical protein